MSKQRTQCVFCGSDSAMSKQHVLPDRLKKLVPRGGESANVITRYQVDAPEYAVIGSEIRRRNASLGTKRKRCVCISCNGGWIERGESAAFNVLTPLILGGSGVLSHGDQAAISLMATTIAIMVDLDDPPTSAVAEAERRFVFENQRQPSNWFHFLAKIDSPDWNLRFRHHGLTAAPQRVVRPIAPNIQISTVGLGKVAIHTVSDRDKLLRFNPSSYANKFDLVYINGAFDIDWGDVPALDGTHIAELADDLFRSLIFNARTAV